jgi:hypothetical protein
MNKVDFSNSCRETFSQIAEKGPGYIWRKNTITPSPLPTPDCTPGDLDFTYNYVKWVC